MQFLTLPVLSPRQAVRALLAGAPAVRVALPGVTRAAERTMEHMQRATAYLLSLPAEAQDRYRILRPPFIQYEDCDDGWIVKRGDEHDPSDLRDRKVYFHCRAALRRWLNDRSLNNSWFRALISDADELRALTFGLLMRLGRAMDAELNQRPDLIESWLLAERSEFVIRVLQYLDVGDEGRLGNEHRDKSFFTTQVGQSIDGLVLIDARSGEHSLVETEPDTAIVFFGKQAAMCLERLAPLVQATEHYIADLRTPGDTRMRNGIVGFAHVLPATEVIHIHGKPGY